MRVRRTIRRELKAELERLTAENVALRAAEDAQTRPAGGAETCAGAERQAEGVSAPRVLGGGFPTRAAPVRARTLKEAKAIWLSLSGGDRRG